jgi:hypothetical protein
MQGVDRGVSLRFSGGCCVVVRLQLNALDVEDAAASAVMTAGVLFITVKTQPEPAAFLLFVFGQTAARLPLARAWCSLRPRCR